MITPDSIDLATQMDSRVPLRQFMAITQWHAAASTSACTPDIVSRDEAIVRNIIMSKNSAYLGVFENPFSAHPQYIQNNPVADTTERIGYAENCERSGLCEVAN